MFDIIKKSKLAYQIYNFFHKKELDHNMPVYKRLGMNKKYYSSVSSKDFAKLTNPLDDNNEPDINKVRKTSLYQSLTPENQESLESFNEKGYAVIKNYLSDQMVDKVNEEIQYLIDYKILKFKYRNKLMFAIHHSQLLWDIGNNPVLKELLSVLLKGNAVLFQSINFIYGSEQATHSDSIHMTTYPLGGLLGVWIALEDITEENGPLHYYPGSHKLPYYLNGDYDNEGTKYFLGEKTYTVYEDMMRDKIVEMSLKKEKFLAKKGDLLIWHANLFHGGDKHLNKNKTRKSMVLHYFNENAICYHEITQRPALMYKKPNHLN